jgi:hypothetical protein
MSDTPPTDAPGEDCPDHGPYGDDDCPKCRSCKGAHHTWQCPEIWKPLRMDALLCDSCDTQQPRSSFQFAHTFDMCICDRCYSYAMSCAPIRCDECGDVIDHPGMCLACQEDTQADVIAGMVHAAFPVLRSGLEMSLERVVIDGVAIPF